MSWDLNRPREVAPPPFRTCFTSISQSRVIVRARSLSVIPVNVSDGSPRARTMSGSFDRLDIPYSLCKIGHCAGDIARERETEARCCLWMDSRADALHLSSLGNICRAHHIRTNGKSGFTFPVIKIIEQDKLSGAGLSVLLPSWCHLNFTSSISFILNASLSARPAQSVRGHRRGNGFFPGLQCRRGYRQYYREDSGHPQTDGLRFGKPWIRIHSS